MIIGYTISAQDNGAYFFNECSKNVLCPKCGTCTDYSWYPDKLELTENIQVKDASCTYDCRLIVSEKFKIFCSEQEYEGIYFYKVSEKPVLYYMIPGKIISFDSDRRKTRFINKCEICGGYESIVGATPAFLRDNSKVDDGLFRSDLAFASGKEKFPIIIIGSETYRKMKEYQLTGVEFKKIES